MGGRQNSIVRQSFNKRLFTLYDEAFLMTSLQHPNIIALFGVTVVSHTERHLLPALVLEAALCTLESRLMDNYDTLVSSDKVRLHESK